MDMKISEYTVYITWSGPVNDMDEVDDDYYYAEIYLIMHKRKKRNMDEDYYRILYVGQSPNMGAMLRLTDTTHHAYKKIKEKYNSKKVYFMFGKLLHVEAVYRLHLFGEDLQKDQPKKLVAASSISRRNLISVVEQAFIYLLNPPCNELSKNDYKKEEILIKNLGNYEPLPRWMYISEKSRKRTSKNRNSC